MSTHILFATKLHVSDEQKRFSFRDVEELLAQRGIVVSSETVRQWCFKFGQTYANELRRCRLCCGDTWHLVHEG